MRVVVNGVRLYFDVDGARLVPDGPGMRERPTLLLLHGGPGMDGSYFRPEFSALADVCQVIYLDQRGAGRSDDGPRQRWTLDQWGDDVRAFCDALEIERPIVCGSSFGAEVAMSYATRHPDHPSKLILLSAAARLNIDRIGAAFARLGGARARTVAEKFWRGMTPENVQDYMTVCAPLYFRKPYDPERDARAVMRPAITLEYLKGGGEAQRANFLPHLGTIACPTLLIGGEDDPVTTIEDMADIAAAIPAQLVRFERLPRCGHGPFFDEPAKTLSLVLDFIAG
jgi:proline iminopeptidase